MGVIINIGEAVKLSAFNVLQEPIKMLMENETEAFEKGSFLSKIFIMRTMDKFQEEYRSRTAMDGFKPTEDMEPPEIEDFGEGYRKIFRTQIWTSSFVISKQAQEDNQMMDINTKAVGFIKSYYRTRERYGAAMISGAVSTSDGFVEFEGKKFDTRGGDTTDGSVDGTGAPQLYFHNAHKLAAAFDNLGNNLTQSNKYQITAGIDLTKAGAPEQLLDAIEQIADAHSSYTDEKGNILALNLDTIVIPANQHRLANALKIALTSKYGTSMGANGVNPTYGAFKVEQWAYLNNLPGFTTDDIGILLIDSEANRDYLGAVWHDRKELEVDSYMDKGNKANVWDGRARFGVGFNNYRAMTYLHAGAQAASGATSGAYANASTITVAPIYLGVEVMNTTTNPVNTQEVSSS